MPAALLALAIGAFGIGTTEFVIMGLLPEVATDFGVSIPSAGLFISGLLVALVGGLLDNRRPGRLQPRMTWSSQAKAAACMAPSNLCGPSKN